MAKVREYWLQLESQPWDASPWGVDRAAGKAMARRKDQLYRGTTEDVLVIRRYDREWSAPAGDAINPWDLTEPDRGDAWGAFPGAVLTAKVADEVVVHFRNMDQRKDVAEELRTHSLHPHGVQRDPLYDGAYPLSPPDPQHGGLAEGGLGVGLGRLAHPLRKGGRREEAKQGRGENQALAIA